MSDKCLFVLMTVLAVNLACAGRCNFAPNDTFTLWGGWIPQFAPSPQRVGLNQTSFSEHLSKLDVCTEIENHVEKLPQWAQDLLEDAYDQCEWFRNATLDVVRGLDLLDGRLRFCRKFEENLHQLDEIPQPPSFCIWSTILCDYSEKQRTILENAVKTCPLPSEVLERILVQPVGNSNQVIASPLTIFSVSILTLLSVTKNIFF